MTPHDQTVLITASTGSYGTRFDRLLTRHEPRSSEPNTVCPEVDALGEIAAVVEVIA